MVEEKKDEKIEEKTEEKEETVNKEEKEEKKPVVTETSEKKEEKTEKPKDEKEEKPENDNKEDEKIEVPAKFKALVEKIEKMSVLDLSELVKILEKKFGVTAVPQVTAVNSAGGPVSAGETEEKSEFNIELKEIGSQKIEVIKVVRDVTGKGLKESKDIVDQAANSPQIVKENVKKEEAEEIKKKFETAGAKVELK